MRTMTKAEKTLQEKREWMKDVAIKLLLQCESPYIIDGCGHTISAARYAAASAKEMADLIFDSDEHISDVISSRIMK